MTVSKKVGRPATKIVGPLKDALEMKHTYLSGSATTKTEVFQELVNWASFHGFVPYDVEFKEVPGEISPPANVWCISLKTKYVGKWSEYCPNKVQKEVKI